MVIIKNLKDMLQIFQKGKILMNLDGFTLNFTDTLNQKFNLRENIYIYIYNNSLIEIFNTKNFE